jgi:hypothetical protein
MLQNALDLSRGSEASAAVSTGEDMMPQWAAESMGVLAEHGIRAEKIIAVHKPYMERRLWSAMQVYWPDVQAVYTSPQVTLAEHIAHAEAIGMTEKGVIETIVGDIQRMERYAAKGYQVPVEIPDDVRAAFHTLVEQGYTGQLAK